MTTQYDRKLRTLLLAVSLEPEEIGARIRDARERKGWTQLEFAFEAAVSPGTIHRWEKGQLPRVHELNRVAELLGISAEELVEPANARQMEGRLEDAISKLDEATEVLLAAAARFDDLAGEGQEAPRPKRRAQ